MSSNSQPLNRPSDMLSERYFIGAVVVALAVHGLAMYGWSLMPRTQVVDVPVRALNVKLGEGDTPEEVKPVEPVPKAVTVSTADNTVSHFVRESQQHEQQNQARQQSVISSLEKSMNTLGKSAAPAALDRVLDKVQPGRGKGFDIRNEGSSIAAPFMPVTQQQFVREGAHDEQTASAAGLTAAAPAASSAEIASRYQQQISLWMQKFKQYPDEAHSQNIEGETVVTIRFDRQGNIQYYALERSTGNQILDRAAIDMIKRANPLPAVPAGYPGGELVELRIPVDFSLK